MTELYKPIPLDHVRAERDLVKFLEDRFTEDRALAQAAIDDPYGSGDCWFDTSNAFIADHYLRHDPERVLADLDAKQYILSQLRCPLEGPADGWTQMHLNAGAVPTERENRRSIRMMKMLAWPYRDHPEWRPEWTAWKADAAFREEW